MRVFCFFPVFVLFPCFLMAQQTFRAGWLNCKAGAVTHYYTYNFNPNDSIRFYLSDSATTYVSADSQVVMEVGFSISDKSVSKTIYYLNAQKNVVKKETYKDENLLEITENTYDKKNRKSSQLVDNKSTGNIVKKLFEYTTDKKSGENVVMESAYNNGRIEFYTRTYYDKFEKKIKEVRLNDNNKDIVHVETFIYGDNGKVKERSVFFPEWKVTKKFEEKEGNETPRCYRSVPLPGSERPSLAGRIQFMKRIIAKNKLLLADKNCTAFEYTFVYPGWCSLVVATTGFNNQRRATISFKDKY